MKLSFDLSVGMLDRCTLYSREALSESFGERARGSRMIDSTRTADIARHVFAIENLARFLRNSTRVFLSMSASQDEVVEALKTAVRRGDVVAIPVRRQGSRFDGGGEAPPSSASRARWASKAMTAPCDLRSRLGRLADPRSGNRPVRPASLATFREQWAGVFGQRSRFVSSGSAWQGDAAQRCGAIRVF